MRRSTFFWFILPSMAMMLVFIALPLASVLVGSFHQTTTVFEQVETESCTPGFPDPVCVTELRNRPVLTETGVPQTVTRFVGFDNYREMLAPERVAASIWGDARLVDLLNVDFYKALRFTLTFTFVTLPLVIGLGLAIAIVVNNAVRAIRGPVIFISLLPFIITPIIGALSIRWLFIGDGIITAWLENITGQEIYMFAQGWTIELLMLFYRVWHVAPFAFVVFYAGLQGVNQDTLESAVIDGASRWERLRYVVIPHLMPLIVFIALIHLMDSYRVFEEVIAFSAQAHRISLQWLTYDLLTPDDSGNRSVARASANSMLTMIGIVLLLIPLLRRTWRDYRGSA